MQQLITIPEVVVQDYGPFVGRHVLRLPTSGLCLLKGLVAETGGGSGAGKSLLASTLAFLFGGCPYPATELQSSYADGPPTVEAPVHTAEGVAVVKRGADLSVTWPGKRALKGKAAAAELDRIFGMDAKMREAVTYRGQDDIAGTFLALSDPDKKKFLTKVLGLDKYERVAAEAAAAAKTLRERLGQARARADEAGLAAKAAAARVSTGLVPDDPEALEEQAGLLEAAAAQLREEAAALARRIETSKDFHWRAYQAAVAALDAELGELRATAETPEETAASDALRLNDAEIQKLRGRLERVRAYDADKRAAHAKRRSGLQDQLATERATQRELERLAAAVPGLRTQEAALGAATCPTCRQGWHDAACRRALESVRAQIDKAHLDAFALPVVREKVAALEAETGALGDYVPHRAGPELQAALAVAAENENKLQLALRRARGAAAEHRALDVQVLETKKRAAKSTAEAAYQTEAAPLSVLRANLLTRADDEDRAARDSRDRAARARTARALIARDEQAARDAAERHRELVEAADALERDMNRELDLHALVGREGFLGVIFDDLLNEIACAANDILGRVANVNHITFQFDIQREAANEAITQAITPVLTLRGRRVDFKSPHISGGQRASVRLAIDLGVGEVVAKRRGFYPGWMVLDETFNGLDAVSKESVMEVLDAYAGGRVILVVDHDDRFQGLFQQRIEIEQLDGRSRIV